MPGQEDEADRDREHEALKNERDRTDPWADPRDDEDPDVLKHHADERRREENERLAPAEQQRQAAKRAPHDGDDTGGD
jgi:hypothetical protein